MYFKHRKTVKTGYKTVAADDKSISNYHFSQTDTDIGNNNNIIFRLQPYVVEHKIKYVYIIFDKITFKIRIQYFD